MRHAQLLPGLAVVGVFEQEVAPVFANSVPLLAPLRAHILGRPIRVAQVGDNRTQAAAGLVFVLGRNLDPVLAVQPQDQAALVILGLRLEGDAGGQGKVAAQGCQQAVTVVAAKAVMRPLPEIGLRFGRKLQPVAECVARGRVEPVEPGGQCLAFERFVDEHAHAPVLEDASIVRAFVLNLLPKNNDVIAKRLNLPLKQSP